MITAREANLKTRQIKNLTTVKPRNVKQAIKYCEKMAELGELSCCFDIDPRFIETITEELSKRGFEVDPIADNKDHDLIFVCWYHNNAKTGDYAIS